MRSPSCAFAAATRSSRLLLGALVIPGQVAMLPLFLMLKPLGLINTYGGAIRCRFSAPPRPCSSAIANAPDELRQSAPRGLRVATAGAPPAAATIERIEGELGWTITQVYGLTETAPFITVCEPRPEHDALAARTRGAEGAPGRGADHVRRAARHRRATGREVPHDGANARRDCRPRQRGDGGLLQRSRRDGARDGGGWFHSGDAAVVHPDGYVEIRDRLKDVIISGGENISSVEVEGVLLRHPAVQEAAIVGLPDVRWGEAPHAFVVLKPGAVATDEELRRSRATASRISRRRNVTFVNELPKTATGKIQKYVLRGGRAAIARQ